MTIELNVDCLKHICIYLPFTDANRFVNNFDDQNICDEIRRSYFQVNWDLLLQIIESNLPSEVVDWCLETFLQHNASNLFHGLINGVPSRPSSIVMLTFRFDDCMDRADVRIKFQQMIVEEKSPFGFTYFRLGQNPDHHIRALDFLCVYGYSKQELIDHCIERFIAGDQGLNIFYTTAQSRERYIDIIFANPIPSIENSIDTISWAWINSVDNMSVFWTHPFNRFGRHGGLRPFFHYMIGDGSDEMMERIVRHPTFQPSLRYYHEIFYNDEAFLASMTTILALSKDPEMTQKFELFLQLTIPLHPMVRNDAGHALRTSVKFMIKLASNEKNEKWGENDFIARIAAMTSCGADPFMMGHGYSNSDGSFNWLSWYGEPTAYDVVANALDDEIVPQHLIPAFSRILEYHLLRPWPLSWQRAITSFTITN
eukprot:scaffold8686_cov122-Skeletonema_menzelii.AAC.4